MGGEGHPVQTDGVRVCRWKMLQAMMPDKVVQPNDVWGTLRWVLLLLVFLMWCCSQGNLDKLGI